MSNTEQVKSILRNIIREISFDDGDPGDYIRELEEQNEYMKFIIRKVFARYPDIIVDALNDKLALEVLPLESKYNVDSQENDTKNI